MILVSETLVSQRQLILRPTQLSFLGGPLLSSNGTIVGVVSKGNPNCGTEGFPGVYARTSAAVDFIKRGICVLSEYPPDYCEDFTPAPTPSPPPPPSNDLCENAVALELGLFSGSTRGATFDDVGLCGTINSGPGVWVSVVGKFVISVLETNHNHCNLTATGTGGFLRADTCSELTSFDTRLTVFSGSCDALTCIGGNDQSCGDSSSVNWISEAGTTYWILIHGYFELTGNFDLLISEPPRNDVCSGAENIAVGEVIFGSTTNATVDDNNNCDLLQLSPGLWYKTVSLRRNSSYYLHFPCRLAMEAFIRSTRVLEQALIPSSPCSVELVTLSCVLD